MKKLVIIIASLVILFPFIFQRENYSIDNLREKLQDFFASSGAELINNGQDEFNRVLDGVSSDEIASHNQEGIKEVIFEKYLSEELSNEETNEDEVDNAGAEEKNFSLLIEVPFSPQAPLKNWQDDRQQDACEEVGVIMAMAWVNNRKELDPLVTENQIITLADWQEEKYGNHRDLYIDEVRTRLFNEYFNYYHVETKELLAKADIITALNAGKIILAPSNGQILGNPYFTPPGPERHLLVIVGYDLENDEFITNDPGTRHGANYRYQTDLLFKAISAYSSNHEEKNENLKKTVLLISKE